MSRYLPWHLYWMNIGLSCASATGAGAVSKTIADWPEAKHAWLIGFSLVFVYAIALAIVWHKQHDSVRYSFYTLAFSSVALMSLALGAALPIFYIMPISTFEGAGLLALFIIILIIHQWMAYRYFNEQWDKIGNKVLEKSVKNNKFDMDFFRKKFDTAGAPNITDVEPFIVGLALKILLILSLLVGLNLRSIYPIFSGFAWAIPAMIIVGVISQVTLMQILRAHRISALEKKLGISLVTDASF